jgi:hypothetical protein
MVGGIPDPVAPAFAVEQPGFGKDPEVVADRGLRQAEGVDEIDDADLTDGRGADRGQQAEASVTNVAQASTRCSQLSNTSR